MISGVEGEQLHKLLIDKFGGSYGIRDKAALESEKALIDYNTIEL